VIACPLFRVEPVEWDAVGPAGFDGLLLTSANAVRHAGPGLDRLKSLPVHAVGEATAIAAREAGLSVVRVGRSDVRSLVADLPDSIRLLHLAGVDHCDLADARIKSMIVYRSVAIASPGLPLLDGLVVAVHSPRAGARLASLAPSRERTAIAAISPAASQSCGEGWERVESADAPNDNRLLALAASLCHTSPPE